MSIPEIDLNFDFSISDSSFTFFVVKEEYLSNSGTLRSFISVIVKHELLDR